MRARLLGAPVVAIALLEVMEHLGGRRDDELRVGVRLVPLLDRVGEVHVRRTVVAKAMADLHVVVRVALRLEAADRTSSASVGELWVSARDGRAVRLDELVRLESATSPSRIDRLDRSRQVSLRTSVAAGYGQGDRIEARPMTEPLPPVRLLANALVNSAIVDTSPAPLLRPKTMVVGGLGSSPAWSPDGKKIVYQADTDGIKQLFVVAPDGTGKKQLTSGTMSHVGAQWSPDGSTIFYRAQETNGNWSIWKMNADGSNPRQVANDYPPVDWAYERLALGK